MILMEQNRKTFRYNEHLSDTKNKNEGIWNQQRDIFNSVFIKKRI